MSNADRSTDIFDVLIEILLIAMIVFPPLALGSVAPWASGILFSVRLILLALWLAQGGYRGQLRIVKTSACFLY